jgi:hypothetical protein
VALIWPVVALLAFFALTGVVVALGASSTARYEFERNGAREPRRAAGAPVVGAHPAGSRLASPAAPAVAEPHAQAVGVVVRPVDATGGDAAAWWLVLDGGAQAVAGPFHDRVDAEWAAWSGGVVAAPRYGVLRADGDVVRRPSPEERAWLTELGDQLDRLPEEWDTLLTDTDPLTTLLVEVAAALVEAGLPLHDSAGSSPSGGVSLMPAVDQGGVLVSWRPHDRMSVHHKRGAEVDLDVRDVMNDAVAGVLERTGFVLDPYGDDGAHLVTAIRP